ncbi:MAG TPA: hypothetical protein VJ805_01880 [Nitrospiraceae bacterium]|nr:hypothetical protein [Nitrospiraceae bacterium]
MNLPMIPLHRMPLLAVSFLLLVSTQGCSYFFYPKADTYLHQAKGSTGPETIANLVGMLESSAKAARAPQTYQAGMDDLHNQLHALDDAYCQVTKQQAATPAYAKATTLRKELWTIFKPLWRNREDQTVRNAHLDLFSARLQEVRAAVQDIKG